MGGVSINPVLRAIDSLIWIVFLAFIVVASFLQGLISDDHWQLFSAGIYGLIAVHIVSILLGGKSNTAGLTQARWVTLLLASMSALLILQIVVPIRSDFLTLLLQSDLSASAQPDWFNPNISWSVVPGLTQWLLVSEVLMLSVFLLTISLVSTRRRVYWLVYTLVFVGFLHALTGIAAKYAGVSLVDLTQVDGHFTPARAWFINRNHFAAFLVLTLMGVLSLQFKLLQNRTTLTRTLIDQFSTPRVLVLIALGVTTVALILSQSRAGLISIVIASGTVYALTGLTKSRLIKLMQYSIPFFAALVLALGYVGDELISRFNSDSLSLGERAQQWSLTWSAIKQTWLIGYGGNSYATVFQAFREFDEFRAVVFNQAHNDYLHIWLEQGLVGLLLWLAVVVLVFRRVRAAYALSKSSLQKSVLFASASVLLAALLQSFVDFNLQILNIRLYFFVIMALVFAVPAISMHKVR